MGDRPTPIELQTVINTLQQDLPTLFERDISYDIYTPDIAFRDPVNHFQGKLAYRIIFWTLRFHGSLFFTELTFDVHNISPHTDANGVHYVLVDWTVRGKLRLPWKTRLLFHGTSTYRLNAAGLIEDHVDTWDRSPQDILRQFLPNQIRDDTP
jgi:hypothetical protein